MIRYKKQTEQVFTADQVGINKLKDDFFIEARNFVYFRKGGWQGFPDSYKCAKDYIGQNPGIIITPVADHKLTSHIAQILRKKHNIGADKTRSYFGGGGGKTKTVRAIYVRGSLSRSQVAAWEKICSKKSAVTITDKQAGEFRYLVNEKRYAIFTRQSSNRLQGVIGTDKSMIANLRDIFDLEYLVALVG